MISSNITHKKDLNNISLSVLTIFSVDSNILLISTTQKETKNDTRNNSRFKTPRRKKTENNTRRNNPRNSTRRINHGATTMKQLNKYRTFTKKDSFGWWYAYPPSYWEADWYTIGYGPTRMLAKRDLKKKMKRDKSRITIKHIIAYFCIGILGGVVVSNCISLIRNFL